MGEISRTGANLSSSDRGGLAMPDEQEQHSSDEPATEPPPEEPTSEGEPEMPPNEDFRSYTSDDLIKRKDESDD